MEIAKGMNRQRQPKDQPKFSVKLTHDQITTLLKIFGGIGLTGVAIFAPVSASVALLLYLIAYGLTGYEVLFNSVKNLVTGKLFDENLLMAIATLGAFGIGQYSEAVAVMIFYKIGEFFEDIAVSHSKKSISALMKVKPEFATLKTATGYTQVAPEKVHPGDIIIVKAGEKVPLDGRIMAGDSSLDTSALTGESAPVSVGVDDVIYSGAINGNGLLTVEVTKAYAESTVAKILDLVQNVQSKKATTDKFITKFCRIYTPAVVLAAAVIAIIPSLLDGNWTQWCYRALIFLVISCPCALVISVPLGFFSGLGAAARHGILIKGSNYLEALKSLDTVVFDKTGTLTKGNFKVTEVVPAASFKKGQLLGYAAAVEKTSTHPIAESIKTAFDGDINAFKIGDVQEQPGYGVSASVNGHQIWVGNAKVLKKLKLAVPKTDDIGTVIYMVIDHQFAGRIIVADEIKPDAKGAIQSLRKIGINQTVMLTGDKKQVGQQIAKQLRLDQVFTELLPEDKVTILQRLKEAAANQNRRVAFVGDGINDAPVLTTADVGIAMGKLGSDAAIEAADVVLMSDQPSKISLAVRISRRTRTIVTQNIGFALVVKAIFLILGAVGIANMWEAVIADVGVTLVAVLNAMRALKIK